MSIEGLIQQLTFSNNSLNVILTWGIAMLGLSLSLLTLSVAFVVSGKTSKDDFIEQIKSKGISISSGSKYKKSSNATMLMQLIAKYSLHWFYVNLFFCIVLISTGTLRNQLFQDMGIAIKRCIYACFSNLHFYY